MSHPAFGPRDSLRASLRRISDDLKDFAERDPEGYAKYLKESRERSYRLAGRNPDGSRK